MKLFRARPVSLLFLCFFVASCLLAYGSFPIRMVAVTAAAVVITLTAAGAVGVRDPVAKQLLTLAATGIVAAGLVSAAAWDFALPWLESRIGVEERAEFRIRDCEFSAVYASRYVAEVTRSGCLPKGTKIVLETTLSGLSEGTVVEGDALYGSLDDLGTEDWNARRTYLSEGVVLQAEGTFDVTGFRPSRTPSAMFARLRSHLTSRFIAGAGRDAGGFASAILLGNRDNLPDTLKRDFRRLGLSHLLAVSGTHFSVMITYLTFFLKKLRLPRRPRAVLSMAVILFFMLLTGGSPSVVRAGLMHLLIQLSELTARKPDTVHSFALSGAVMTLFSPFSAASCGLQLSFAATWACIVWLSFRGGFARLVRRAGKGKRGLFVRFIRSLSETVILTVVVTLATVPLIWSYFGELPLLSVPANLLFVPVVTLTLGICWLCLILSPIRFLAAPVFRLLIPLYGLIEGAALRFAWIPGTVIPVRYAFAPFLLIPAALCLICVPLFGKRGRRCAAVSAAVLTVLFLSLTAVFRAVSLDDAVFIRAGVKKNEGFLLMAENRILLCDMSDGSSGVFGRLTAKMDDCHACEIDTVLLTHYHNKHVRLLGQLFTRQIVRSLWLPEPDGEDEAAICRSLTDLCAENGVELTVLPAGEEADFHGIGLSVFGRTRIGRSSHPVSAVRVNMPSGEVLFASSSFNESDELIRAAEEADVLILGAHSPVYKKTFALSFRGGAKILALCADARAYADPDWFRNLTANTPGCRIVDLDAAPVFELRDRRS